MSELAFRYVTNLCWVKDRSGLGQYFRGRHELLLFGVRGQGYEARTERKDLDTCFGLPRGEHSAKPLDFYAHIEARSKGPYLEMFARSDREGWKSWGNEVA
jgi:N6-adenosine-specific RNA methylase IME4